MLLGFFWLVDRRKRLHRELVEKLAAVRHDIATTAIPTQSLIEQMAEHRAPVPVFAPRSLAARRYDQLLDEALAGHPII